MKANLLKSSKNHAEILISLVNLLLCLGKYFCKNADHFLVCFELVRRYFFVMFLANFLNN